MSEIKLQINTPLWNGDIDKKSNKIQLSCIIGSLRWWTEVIFRAMGKSACDPTGDNRCPQEDSHNKKISYYCDACSIFGATGLRRSFKMEITGGKHVYNGNPLNIKPNGRSHGWYLGSGLMGELNFRLIPLDSEFKDILILAPLIVASKWAGIGAKTQLGYGVVDFEFSTKITINDFENASSNIENNLNIKNYKSRSRDKIANHDNLPNIKNFFFTKVQFEVVSNNWWEKVDGLRNLVNDKRLKKWAISDSVPISPAMKNWLRFGENKKINDRNISVSPFEEIFNKNISQQLFGSLNPKQASKINISCAYPIYNNIWEFRIWGWIPKNLLPDRFDKEKSLNSLKTSLENKNNSLKIPWVQLLGSQTKNHRLNVWREHNSDRDTLKKETDINIYLQSLLNGAE